MQHHLDDIWYTMSTHDILLPAYMLNGYIFTWYIVTCVIFDSMTLDTWDNGTRYMIHDIWYLIHDLSEYMIHDILDWYLVI